MTPAELRGARAALDKTQAEMANTLGLNSGRAVRAYENGERRIPGTVEKLVKKLLEENAPLA